MHVIIAISVGDQQSTEVFQGFSTAVLRSLFDTLSLREMEVFFHEETDVDGGDGKKEVILLFRHIFYCWLLSLQKILNEFQRKNASSTQISLRSIALESQFEPVSGCNALRTLLTKIQPVKILYEVPSFVAFEHDLCSFSQIVPFFEFLLRQAVILARRPLPTRHLAGMRNRLSLFQQLVMHI